MDGDLFSVITGHLRHKTLEPEAIFNWDLVKPERSRQFVAMFDFLGLRNAFGNRCAAGCGCKADVSQSKTCSYCGKQFTETWKANNGYRMCSDCHLHKYHSRKRSRESS